MKKKTVLIVFGTRPEAIKMCPLVKELRSRQEIKTVVCVTGQHRQMLDQVLEAFDVVPEYDLSIMKSQQNLFDITCNVLLEIKRFLRKYSRISSWYTVTQVLLFCGFSELLSANTSWAC